MIGFAILVSPMFALTNISAQYKRDKIFKQLSLTPLTKTDWLLAKIGFYIMMTSDLVRPDGACRDVLRSARTSPSLRGSSRSC